MFKLEKKNTFNRRDVLSRRLILSAICEQIVSYIYFLLLFLRNIKFDTFIIYHFFGEKLYLLKDYRKTKLLFNTLH